MNATEVVEMFRSAIANTRQSGATQVTLDELDSYAKFLEDTAAKTPNDVAAGQAAMERYKADLSAWIDARKQRHEYNLEMLRAVITTGQAALKSALLINGGAAVALLAFLGSAWPSRSSACALHSVSTALLLYVLGVLSAAIAAGATYFSQAGYGNEFGKASIYLGRIGHGLAVLAVFCSYGLFGRASWLAYIGVSGG